MICGTLLILMQQVPRQIAGERRAVERRQEKRGKFEFWSTSRGSKRFLFAVERMEMCLDGKQPGFSLCAAQLLQHGPGDGWCWACNFTWGKPEMKEGQRKGGRERGCINVLETAWLELHSQPEVTPLNRDNLPPNPEAQSPPLEPALRPEPAEM